MNLSSYLSGLLPKYLSLIAEQRPFVITDEELTKLLNAHPAHLESRRLLTASECISHKFDQAAFHRYEEKYQVKLPVFAKYLLSELGQSRMLGITLADISKKEIWAPECYLTYDFFIACVHAGMKQEKIDTLISQYQLHTNRFIDEEAQRIYEGFGCEVDKCVIKLLFIGHGSCAGSQYVVLSECDAGRIVHDGDAAGENYEYNGETFWLDSFGRMQVPPFEEYCIILLERRLKYLYTREEIDSLLQGI
ncbi:hypothetical protein CLV59_103156 [Chitinophaga dinghuensis]|uniref:SMI1/KNR4 family protein n=1 Tax=Chitinophaga dinghuensis TaxID=1539050 RepID=A0A327W4B0_9BACT|nr:hypothetical protein [Chitinophaga dinghuensis]RAJ83196.1 hypothetical protein CLV59_103156 [Chitinophaga dinghuensis]